MEATSLYSFNPIIFKDNSEFNQAPWDLACLRCRATRWNLPIERFSVEKSWRNILALYFAKTNLANLIMIIRLWPNDPSY